MSFDFNNFLSLQKYSFAREDFISSYIIVSDHKGPTQTVWPLGILNLVEMYGNIAKVHITVICFV